MDKAKLFARPALYIVLGVYFILGFTTLALGDRAARFLFDEDRYFENTGALALFIASGLSFYAFYIARKVRRVGGIFWGRQLVYFGFALLYFFGAGEEISWGQRIFGIEQPAQLAEANVQEELNIHNLAVFENSRYLKADDIFSIFWFGFAVLIPAGSLLSKKFRSAVSKWIPIVHWGIGLMFLFNFASARLSKVVFQSVYSFPPVPFVQAVQEIKESNYEVLFAFLSLYVLVDLLAATRQAAQGT